MPQTNRVFVFEFSAISFTQGGGKNQQARIILQLENSFKKCSC